jgi:hypothetical protein
LPGSSSSRYALCIVAALGGAYGKAMTEPTTARPEIDPTLKALLDAFR